MAVDYKKQIGFKGQFYIEPKPKEPTKHQYDSDAAACLNFLREYDLLKDFKLNIETNHATLAGHTVEHELEYAGHQGFLGSVDANTGASSRSGTILVQGQAFTVTQAGTAYMLFCRDPASGPAKVTLQSE